MIAVPARSWRGYNIAFRLEEVAEMLGSTSLLPGS